MAVIGNIRKHSIFLMVIVGLAMFLFIISSFLDNNTLRWLKVNSTLSSIDGNDIEQDYQKFYEQYSALAQIYFQTTTLDENQSAMVHREVWNQIEEEILLGKELAKAGLELSKEERDDYMPQAIASFNTNNPDQMLMILAQHIAQIATPEAAFNFIQNAEAYAHEEGVKNYYNAYKAIERIGLWNKQKRKFYALLNHSVYYPAPLLEKLAEDQQTATVQLVNFSTYLPAFAKIKPEVSDKEIKERYETEKYRFYSPENERDIDAVVFGVSPSAIDLKTIEDSVYQRFERLTAASDLFIYSSEDAQIQLDSNYHKKDAIYIHSLKNTVNVPGLDSLIFKRPVGTLITPFSHDKIWYYGKTFGRAMRPDSIQIALIRIDYKAVNQNITRTKKEAKALLDSIYNVLLKNPALFDTLRVQYSAIPKLDSLWITDGMQDRNFFNPMINVPFNKAEKLELDMGLFIVMKLNQTVFFEKMQYAIFTEQIIPSQRTIDSINNLASKLALSSNSVEELAEAAHQQGLPLVNGKNIKGMDASIGQLQSCRAVVKWAFDKETQLGTVASQPFNLDNNSAFVVAGLKSIHNRGTLKQESVKDMIKMELENEKKIEQIADMITADIKTLNTLDTLAQKYSGYATEARLSFIGDMRQNYNIDGKGIVKIFNLQPSENIQVIPSKTGVYAVVVKSIDKTPASKDFTTERFNFDQMTGKNNLYNLVVDGLRKNTSFKDNRHLRY